VSEKVQMSDKLALVKAVKTHLPGCIPNVIFDVGANTGNTAIGLARSFPDATVYAFEPVAATFSKMSRNVLPHPHIQPFNLALGARSKRPFEAVKSYLE
jgi:FkbM family methyltransferase